MKACFILVAAFFLPTLAWGGRDFDKKYMRARTLYEAGNYNEALKIYLELYRKDSSNCNVCYKTGSCYLKTERDRKKALYFLQRASKKVSAVYNDELATERAAPVKLFRLLGDAYHLNYQFDEAIASYERFLKEGHPDREKAKDIRRKIEQCHNGKQLVAAPINVKLVNLGPAINSPHQEYAPMLTADQKVMIFTAKRPENTGGKTYDGGQYFEDVYISRKTASGWTKAENLGSPINTVGNEAAVSISADGQEILIYKDDLGDGNIYHSKLEGKTWTVPQKLNAHVNSGHWEPAACLSADGNAIYFVSDRPGGFGGTDIYRCTRTPKGEWGRAVNLGPGINTPYDEHSPFIHADGVSLYFSSKGHKSMGGFDVFLAKSLSADGKKWTEPENIGYPLNTTGDDAYFTVTTDRKRGYYSSSAASEDNYGEKDIFEIQFLDAVENPPVALLSGKVNSCDGSCGNVQITVADNKTGEVLAVYQPNSETSRYSFVVPSGKPHNITYEAEGYMFCSVSEYSGDYKEKDSVVCLQPIKEGAVTRLSNIFFDFDDSKLRPASAYELERLYQFLLKNPGIKVEICGYADSRGTDSYNLKLSKARAQSVVTWLREKGIDPQRMVAVGYGAVKNTGRDKGIQPGDRRVELKILEIKK